jgi:hypothetical protein
MQHWPTVSTSKFHLFVELIPSVGKRPPETQMYHVDLKCERLAVKMWLEITLNT